MQHAEKACSENEVQLASSTWQQGHLKDRLGQADARDLEQQGKIRELLEQLDGLRATLRSSQDAAQAARERIGYVEGEAAVARETSQVTISDLMRQVESLGGDLTSVKMNKLQVETELRGHVDHHESMHLAEKGRHSETQDALERLQHNLRFEQDVRAEKERHLKDHEQKIIEGQLSIGMLNQRLGEANAKYEKERETVRSLEAMMRLKEREYDKELAERTQAAKQVEETLRVQLRAAKELSEARQERGAHDKAVAETLREELSRCRAAKLQVEDTLELALRAAAKEKAELDER